MDFRAVAILVALASVTVAGCLGSGTGRSLSEPSGIGEATALVLVNGKLWTADEGIAGATAIAILGERILAVGSDEDVLAAEIGERPLVIDLDGRMVLPGLHDTHNHFAEVARAYDPASSPANPYDPWEPGWDLVMGTANQQMIAAGHVGVWADHNVVRVMNGELPAPPEGRLAANDLWFGGPPRQNADDVWSDVLQMGLATGARYGLTSHVEAGTGLGTFEVLEGLDAAGDLTARFNLYIFPEDLDEAIDGGWSTGSGDDDVRLLGMKIYSDGWLGPRTAALRSLYNDRPHQGFVFYTQGEADAYVARAHATGFKVTAHAIGDRATEMLLIAYERAMAEGCPDYADYAVCDDPRFSLEHASLLGPDLVDRAVGLDLVPSIQFSFATSDSHWAEMALGSERLDDLYPWQTLVDRGLTVGGSSDFPIEVIAPLWGVERMVTRTDLDGYPEGGFMPEEAVSLETALRMITINAAYLEFREHELGSLTPGKLADLVVLDRDLFEIPPETIADATVELTMVGGRPVFTSPALAGPLGVAPGAVVG